VYRKYRDKLVELLEKGLSREDLSLISKEFLRIMEKVCRECQANRMHCILMPKCGRNRPFLSMLIEMNVKKEDLPDFCYSQFLKEIQMAFKGIRTLRDVSVRLEDFLKTVFRDYRKIHDFLMSRNLRELSKIVSKEPAVKNKRVLILEKNGQIYFAINGLNFRIDVNRKLVYFNPYDTPITSLKELEAFIELFSLEADMSVEIEREIGGILSLDIHFPVEVEVKNFELQQDLINTIFEKYRDKIESFFNHVHLYVSQDEVHVLSDLEIGGIEKLERLTPKELIEAFKVLKDFRNDLHEKLAKSVKK